MWPVKSHRFTKQPSNQQKLESPWVWYPDMNHSMPIMEGGSIYRIWNNQLLSPQVPTSRPTPRAPFLWWHFSFIVTLTFSLFVPLHDVSKFCITFWEFPAFPINIFRMYKDSIHLQYFPNFKAILFHRIADPLVVLWTLVHFLSKNPSATKKNTPWESSCNHPSFSWSSWF